MPLAGSLLCGGGVEDTPWWVGVSGIDGTDRGTSLVALNLCIMRRYYLGEGDLVSRGFP